MKTKSFDNVIFYRLRLPSVCDTVWVMTVNVKSYLEELLIGEVIAPQTLVPEEFHKCTIFGVDVFVFLGRMIHVRIYVNKIDLGGGHKFFDIQLSDDLVLED